ncbi:MAG: DUF1364 family protein [Candidatus Sabulitectum sp.]|nr:DUF1364 family protein [Candidatus Sabulitectum sp.]
MSKQDKYTRSAKDQICQIRLPGSCNGNPETTILAHLGGAGMAMKHLNIHGAYACSGCHDAVDFRAKTEWTQDQLKRWHLEGVIRTQIIMVKEGVLEL